MYLDEIKAMWPVKTVETNNIIQPNNHKSIYFAMDNKPYIIIIILKMLANTNNSLYLKADKSKSWHSFCFQIKWFIQN